jgi:hypothetical protein
MNRQTWQMLAAVLVLMAGTAGLIGAIREHQKLAPPGVKTHALPGSIRLEAELPARVLDYDSHVMDVGDITVNTLPPDTSFGYRRYEAADRPSVDLRVVLMGTDRTSLHKPQFCLTGQGWEIDETIETRLPVEKPFRYDLPVIELVATRTENGHRTAQRAIYVYWFVAADGLSASAVGLGRMWSMAEQLVRTGTLQRWAYVSCFAVCSPGEEKNTFEGLKKFIAASVPEFQLYPSSNQNPLVRD